ncbi:MAG: PA14 domain-containing protein [Ilumatobacteraceae bacterium]
MNESLDERLKREQAAAPKPAVVGFDANLSVEDPDGRTSHGTTYKNVDGTWTSVIDDNAVHYLVDGEWQKIDPRVIPTRTGEWVTKASDHVVTFSSKSIGLAVGTESVSWVPAEAALPTPQVSEDGLTVTYPNVWPGVDLRYRLSTDMVAEEIVISDTKSVPVDGSFAFDVTGPGLKTDGDGAASFEGAFGEGVGVGRVEVFDTHGLPISDAENVSLTVGDRKTSGNDKVDRLTVTVDPAWVSQLPADAFPLVVDPSVPYFGPSVRVATSNVGGTCSTNPLCDSARIGNIWTTVNRYWRTGVQFNYAAYLPTSTVASQLTSATLKMGYMSGSLVSHPIYVRKGTSTGYCGAHQNNDCGQASTSYLTPLQNISNGWVYYDVMSYLSPSWTAGAPMVTFALAGNEAPWTNTYKRISTELTLTYNRLPIPQQANMSPGNPYTFHYSADGIHLSINPLSDPDGDALYYRFLLCTLGCTTIADDSGWDSVGSPDSSPWDYYSDLYPPGPGLTAWFYNQQLYWQVMVSNSPTGAGLVAGSAWNAWKLVNNCPASPQMFDPGGGSGGFTWAPNNPPTLTITPYADPDGDSAGYRFVIRKKGGGGYAYVTSWSALTLSLAQISFTIPADSGLEPGTAYEWSAEAQDSTTYFHWYHFQNGPCAAASSFRAADFEARLGVGGPSPTQSLGPVAVNLATGNVTTAVAAPQVSTLGGAMGASLAYNSRANDIGLRARLYNDSNGNMAPDAGELQASRVDRELSFEWASPGAVPGITNFVGTWTGYLTVPTAGTYHIAAAVGADERVEIKVGTAYTVQANYVNAAAIGFNLPKGIGPSAYNSFANVSATSGGFTATAWQVFPISVTYRNPASAGYLALYLSTNGSTYGNLPQTWLAPDVRVVPRGWTFNHLDGAGASYTSARVEATAIVLTRADGSTVSFARNASGGYTPPPDENDVVGYSAGKVTVTDAGGAVHQFNNDGQLETITAPLETKTPAAPTPVWTSVTLSGSTVATSRMTAMTDPISARQVTFKYEGVGAGSCPSAGGFVAPLAGMLCQITYPDGSTTKLFFVADGLGSVQLSRIENPGDATLGHPTLDLGYTLVSMPAPSGGTYSVPLLSTVRDPLVNDAIAAGQISASGDYLTSIAYDGNGRASSVTAPKPSPTATFRQQVFIDYQTAGGVTFNETRLRVLGLDDTGLSTDWDRKVEFDSTARTTREYQGLNAASTQFILSEFGWDTNSSSDRLLWAKSAKQLTRNVYSPEGWVTDSYGPANESCFDSTTKMPNGTCTNPAVPHTSTVYDGGLSGLSVTAWANNSFSGPPSNMATGISGSSSLSYNWGASGPAEATNAGGAQLTDNFSMRLTGSIVFPATGTYTFSTNSPDDVLHLYVDDQLVFAGGWGVNSSGTFVLPSGSTLNRRMRIDYVEYGSGAGFTLNWNGTGTGGTVPVPVSALKPRYGLVTSTTVDDSGGATPSLTTTISYSGPNDVVYGLATSVTSGGLTTATAYEAGNYRRRTSRTLPAGNQTVYEYYANAASVDNPCTVASDPVNQGGLLRKTTDPVAQNGKQIIAEQVYDNLARPVASRRGTRTSGVDTWETTWACITFDARHRPTTVSVPNNAGSAIERTITTSYSVGGDPRKTSVTDPVGTITSESDLLGRGVTYTDVWGTVTASSYDLTGEPGRLGQTTVTTSASVVAATHAWDYDRAGRLTAQFLDGETIAIPTYNAPGSTNEHTLSSVSYPSGVGNSGNGTSLAAITRDTNGAVVSTTWNQGVSGFFTNTVTRSQTGRVITDSVNGGNTSSFVYDTAGRLTQATQPGHVLQYQYGAQTGCSGNNLLSSSGANSNRTALIDNSVTIASYCYDTADRLVSTTAAGYGGGISYDDHGNTTSLAGETLAYDGADRHVSTTANGVTVTYTRDVTDRIVARTIPAPGATPVFRDSGAAADNGSGATSLVLDRPAATVPGDVLLAVVARVGATVTAPSGWTAIASASNAGVATTLFWRLASGGDPSSWTFTLSASEKAAGQIVAYSGVHATFPIDVTATAATASGTTHAAPQVTSTEDNRLLLTITAAATDTTWTPAAGATERVDVAGVSGAPTVTVGVAEHEQLSEGLSATQSPTSATAAVGAATTIALRPPNSTVATKTLRYSYSGGADATALTMTSSNVLLDRTISLPGGVQCSGLTAATATWAYPNIHGDVTYTIDETGVASGPNLYDPFGQPLTGVSNTSPGDFDNGWLGQHQRPTEHQPGLKQTIEMGARSYRADLGRFLRVDPIDGGATYSDYAYVVDPINQLDLTGKRCSGREGSKGSCGVDYLGTGKMSAKRMVVAITNKIYGASIGIGGGYCAFLCVPEIGMSDQGPYIKLAMGFAFDSPGIHFDIDRLACGSAETQAYWWISVGPLQLSVGASKPESSAQGTAEWQEEYDFSIGFPKRTGLYKPVGGGGGVKYQWTLC